MRNILLKSLPVSVNVSLADNYLHRVSLETLVCRRSHHIDRFQLAALHTIRKTAVLAPMTAMHSGDPVPSPVCLCKMYSDHLPKNNKT